MCSDAFTKEKKKKKQVTHSALHILLLRTPEEKGNLSVNCQ